MIILSTGSTTNGKTTITPSGISHSGKPQDVSVSSVVDIVHTTGPFSLVNSRTPNGSRKPYLSPETVKSLWTPVVDMHPPESLNTVRLVVHVVMYFLI